MEITARILINALIVILLALVCANTYVAYALSYHSQTIQVLVRQMQQLEKTIKTSHAKR
ncbi:hypothetical protein [Helicobacter ailurogastricus]|uniref:hypothetical protein n=1 Tax=Helicobacter ailurogastricus TaxID=1578720 RepID=UPI001315255C|nr:hypothetical protein [Helicobacter ailurogastricus]